LSGGYTYCYETDCGYYLGYGYTCSELENNYGYDCDLCDDQGYCNDDGGGAGYVGGQCYLGYYDYSYDTYYGIYDCNMNCNTLYYYYYYPDDSYCDDGSYYNYDCAEFDYDGGDCDDVGGGDCDDTCYGYNCDYWVNDGYTCDGTDQEWGCDLTCYDNDGGDCDDVGGGDCDDTCYGYNCDYWVNDGYTCDECDDSGGGDGSPGSSCSAYIYYYDEYYGYGSYWVEDGTYDCFGNCFPAWFLEEETGDGDCDDYYDEYAGPYGINCAEFDYDGGDCDGSVAGYGGDIGYFGLSVSSSSTAMEVETDNPKYPMSPPYPATLPSQSPPS
jgi:hypothetical protein